MFLLRFLWLYFMLTLPIWLGIISTLVVMIMGDEE